MYFHQRYYERANKAHTLLVKMLREDAAQRTPHLLRTPGGGMAHVPSKVAEVFQSFFSKLYSLPETLPADPRERSWLIGNFLSSWQLPRLPPEALMKLNAPITSEEISEVLTDFPAGKASGPDGLTDLYCQTFSNLLSSQMASLYNTFLSGELVSNTMLHSYITLIPKPRKDPTDCSNFRLIALLNSDLKVFTKMLSNRLTLWLP